VPAFPDDITVFDDYSPDHWVRIRAATAALCEVNRTLKVEQVAWTWGGHHNSG
jgi:hypothetical protein